MASLNTPTVIMKPNLNQINYVHSRRHKESNVAATRASFMAGPTMPGGQEFRGQVMTIRDNKEASNFRRSSTSAPGRIECRTLNDQQSQRTQKAIVQRTQIPPTLVHKWREVQGGNNWEGMLDPMDSDLREEVIRYGEFAQACYDAFDNDEGSKYRGSCRYSRDNLLNRVGLSDTGYEVTKYLYSTTDVKNFLLRNDDGQAWSRDSNWMGYVAVCTDENRIRELGRRDIVIAWRGTATKLEWAADLALNLVPSSLDKRSQSSKWYLKLELEQGFLSLYTTKNSNTRYNKNSAREQLLSELRRLIKKYDDETLSITVTGHSLGAALAVLSAYDIAESGINCHSADVDIPSHWNQPTTPTPTSDPSKTAEKNSVPLTVFSFAGPRVGNNPFIDRIKELGVKVLRAVNTHDLVPDVPGLGLGERFRFLNKMLDQLPWTYSHCGVEIEVNSDHSPYLRPHAGPANAHNLEAYLHLLAGYQGSNPGHGDEFKLHIRRDIALVNKSSDLLKPQHYIPTCWWQLENKGLVLNDDGEWAQPDRDPEDIPTSYNHQHGW